MGWSMLWKSGIVDINLREHGPGRGCPSPFQAEFNPWRLRKRDASRRRLARSEIIRLIFRNGNKTIGGRTLMLQLRRRIEMHRTHHGACAPYAKTNSVRLLDCR
jgi:hypothetical protein